MASGPAIPRCERPYLEASFLTVVQAVTDFIRLVLRATDVANLLLGSCVSNSRLSEPWRCFYPQGLRLEAPDADGPAAGISSVRMIRGPLLLDASLADGVLFSASRANLRFGSTLPASSSSSWTAMVNGRTRC